MQKTLFAAITRPTQFFSRDNDSFREILFAFLFTVLATSLLYFLTTLPNLGKLRMAAAAMSSGFPANGQNLPALPWNRLMFPVFWIVAAFCAGLIRFLTLRFLGESQVSISRVQTVSMVAILPLMISSGILGVWGNFAHVTPASGLTSYSIVSLVCFFLMIFAELIVCVSAFRKLFSQNIGRAIVVWGSPYALGCSGCVVPAFFVILIPGLR